MGKVVSKIGRRANQRFNIEHRAQKAIEKQTEIPKMAPRHPSTVDQFKALENESSKLKEELDRKNDALLEKLKNVRIDSYGPAPEIKASSSRSMPQNRIQVMETDSGFTEPDVIPPGKITVRVLIEVLGKHMVEPKKYAATEIAAEHSLDKQKVENVLKYFQSFSLYVPKTGEVIAGNLRGGEAIDATLLEDKKNQLEDGKDKKGFKINVVTKKPDHW